MHNILSKKKPYTPTDKIIYSYLYLSVQDARGFVILCIMYESGVANDKHPVQVSVNIQLRTICLDIIYKIISNTEQKECFFIYLFTCLPTKNPKNR